MRVLSFFILSMLLLSLPCTAQRRRTPVKKQQQEEEPAEDPRIVQMRAATQQIIFIDSMVVSRDDFMSYIPLSPHVGQLSQTGDLGTYTNEMGDHRLVTTADTLIASSDFIAAEWTSPQPIGGIGEAPATNPFLMPDGVTLYFAQKGERSIGGFDIFVTRYDSEKGSFLKPENLGMPFASEADDLFYAVDEFNQLGYFVTNRRQPEGMVCIYTFIPEDTRRIYRSEAYSDEQMRALAAMMSIADTWGDGEERMEALARLEAAQKAKEGTNASIPLYGRNNTELDNLRHQAATLAETLAQTRLRYANASISERTTMRSEILASERQLEDLQLEIRQKEKQIPINQ